MFDFLGIYLDRSGCLRGLFPPFAPQIATFGSEDASKKFEAELMAEMATEIEAATVKNKEKDVFRSAKSSFVVLFFGIVLFGGECRARHCCCLGFPVFSIRDAEHGVDA